MKRKPQYEPNAPPQDPFCLPDLEHAKTAVLNSLTLSVSSVWRLPKVRTEQKLVRQ